MNHSAIGGAHPAAALPAPGDLPAVLFEATPGPAAGRWTNVRDWSVTVRQARFRPAPAFFDLDGHRLCVLGRPILGERMDSRAVAAAVVSRPAADVLPTLNGEFTIVHSPPSREELRIVSCRFAYPTTFYSEAPDRFLFGATFADVWERLSEIGRARLNPQALFEYLNYKRVFGDKTPESSTCLLGPARVLRFDGEGLRTETYWRPDFRRKLRISVGEGARLLVERVQRSLRRRTQDEARFSLFLSGGMDTRLLLGALGGIGVRPTCFTINAYENREVQVARQAAAIAGARHVFLQTPPGHYAKTFATAARLTGAQYMPMCMFIGLADTVAEHADVGFHGHGFDYFFQGMYLPRWNPKVGRRTLFVRFPARVPSDLVGYFLDHISYAIRTTTIARFCRADVYNQRRAQLRTEMEEIAAAAREVTDSAVDALEYLTFSNLARHYSCGDHWGINTLVEQRTASFDNDVYDLYQTIPTRLRFDARAQRAALQLLDPRYGELIAANHRFPMRYSSARRTVNQVVEGTMRALGMRGSAGDDRFERMGTPFDHLLATEWRPRVEALRDSPRLADLDFLDMDALRRYLDARLADGAFGYDQVLVGLLVIDRLMAGRAS